MCVEGGTREGMGTCTCMYGGGQGVDGDMYMCVEGGETGMGWRHVHVCVDGDQGGAGDMYMCVWRGGQGGYRDMYIIWLYVICNKRYLKNYFQLSSLCVKLTQNLAGKWNCHHIQSLHRLLHMRMLPPRWWFLGGVRLGGRISCSILVFIIKILFNSK